MRTKIAVFDRDRQALMVVTMCEHCLDTFGRTGHLNLVFDEPLGPSIESMRDAGMRPRQIARLHLVTMMIGGDRVPIILSENLLPALAQSGVREREYPEFLSSRIQAYFHEIAPNSVPNGGTRWADRSPKSESKRSSRGQVEQTIEIYRDYLNSLAIHPESRLMTPSSPTLPAISNDELIAMVPSSAQSGLLPPKR